MNEPVTASYVITQEQKRLVQRWAYEADRSASWIVRQILEAESRRRAAEAETARKMHPQRN